MRFLVRVLKRAFLSKKIMRKKTKERENPFRE